MSRFGAQTRQGSQVRTWSKPYVPPVSYLRGRSEPVRPSDWISTPSASGQEIEFIFKVYEGNGNYIALKAAGNYNVDWGDGSSANFSASAQAERNIQWSDAPSATITSEGFRQVRIVVTPQAGQNLTYADFDVKHTSVSANSTNQDNMITEMAVSGSNFTSFTLTTIEPLFGSPDRKIRHSSLRYFKWHGTCGVSNWSGQFYEMWNLQEVYFDDCSSWTTANRTFQATSEIKYISLPNMSSVSSAIAMFNTSGVERVNLENLSGITNASSMFYGCRYLQYISIIGTTSLTNVAEFFSECYQLQTVYMPDLASVTIADSMFNSCTALISVKLNMPALVSAQNMFNTTRNLTECKINNGTSLSNVASMFANSGIPTLNLTNFSGVKDFRNIFNSSRIENVTFDSLSAVNDTSSAFNSASSIKSVTLTGLGTSCSNMTQMFFGASSLEYVDFGTSTSNVVNINNLFFLAYSLKEIVNLDTVSASQFSSSFNSVTSLPELSLNASTVTSQNNITLAQMGTLQKLNLTNCRITHSIANNRFQAAELNNHYTNLPTLTARNINAGTVASSSVTVTTTVAHGFYTNQTIVVAGVNPSTYNGTFTITVVNATQFRYIKAGVGAYVSGGTATPSATVTVTNNPGTASDSPSIATNKGWTVTG